MESVGAFNFDTSWCSWWFLIQHFLKSTESTHSIGGFYVHLFSPNPCPGFGFTRQDWIWDPGWEVGGFLDNSHKESTSVTLSPASAFPAKKNICARIALCLSAVCHKVLPGRWWWRHLVLCEFGFWKESGIDAWGHRRLPPERPSGSSRRCQTSQLSISGIFLTKSLSLTNHHAMYQGFLPIPSNSQSLILEVHWPLNMSTDIAIQLLVQKFTQSTPKDPGCQGYKQQNSPHLVPAQLDLELVGMVTGGGKPE